MTDKAENRCGCPGITLLGFTMLSALTLWIGMVNINDLYSIQEVSVESLGYSVLALALIQTFISVLVLSRGSVTDGLAQFLAGLIVSIYYMALTVGLELNSTMGFVILILLIPTAVYVKQRNWILSFSMILFVVPTFVNIFVSEETVQLIILLCYILSGILTMFYSSTALIYIETGDESHNIGWLFENRRRIVDRRGSLLVILPISFGITIITALFFAYGEAMGFNSLSVVICSLVILSVSAVAVGDGMTLFGGSGLVIGFRCLTVTSVYLSLGESGFALDLLFSLVQIIILSKMISNRKYVLSFSLLFVVASPLSYILFSEDWLTFVITTIGCILFIGIGAYNLITLEFGKERELLSYI